MSKTNRINDALDSINQRLDHAELWMESHNSISRVWNDPIQQAASDIAVIRQRSDELTIYAKTDLIASSLVGTGEGAYRAFMAFASEPPRNKEGAVEIMSMVGSAAKLLAFVPQLGAVGGPLGVVIGELLSFASMFLLPSSEQQKSVGDQLEIKLRELAGEERADELAAVLQTGERVGADLGAIVKLSANSKSWDELLTIGDFENGMEVLWLGKAASWLKREENQHSESWAVAFEAYVFAASQFLQNFVLALTALKKLDTDGKPNDDMLRALAVLNVIYRQHREFIDEITPVAQNNGTVWHIGTNQELYTRKQVIGSETWHELYGDCTDVAISPVNRIWTLKANGQVFTGFDSSRKQLEGMRDYKVTDIWAVPMSAARASTNASGAKAPVDVYMLRDGILDWGLWDESGNDHGDPTFVEMCLLTNFGGALYRSVHATSDGLAYLLNDQSNALVVGVAQHYKSPGPGIPPGVEFSPKPVPLPVAGTVDGLTTNESKVFVFAGKRLWCKAHAYALDSGVSWTEIVGPVSNDDFKMPDGWKFDDVFACDDGTVLAIIDTKIYSWYDEKWSKNDNAEAVGLFKEPVRGYEMFWALSNLVEAVRGAGSLDTIPWSPIRRVSATSGQS